MRRNSAEVADVKVIAHPASDLVPEPSPADPPNSRILVIDDAQAIHDGFCKILVEDDEPVRSLTRRLLENFGYPAEAADKDPAVFCKPRTCFLEKPSPWRDLLRTVRQCLDEE
jgi:hypothetical protein